VRNLAAVLDGTAGLAGVQWLLVGQGPRAALRATLANLLGKTKLQGSCRLRRTRFQPGHKLTAYYDVHFRLEGSHTPVTRAIAVTWKAKWIERRDHRPYGKPRAASLEAEAQRRGLMAPFRAFRADVPEWGMRLELSPIDPKFPQLVRLCDPKYVGEVLAKVLHRDSNAPECAPLSRYAVASIRYFPGIRHVLRYRPASAGNGAVFAKLYAGENGARVHRVTMSAASWVEAHGRNMTCLRPLAHIAGDKALLYPQVAGAPLSKRLRRGSRDVGRLLEASGGALNTLQQAPLESCLPPAVKAGDFETQLAEIVQAGECIGTLLPSVRSTIRQMMDDALAIHARLPQEPPRLIHGDFKPEHVWQNGSSLTVIDLDLSRPADPALDLGKFLGDLPRWCDGIRGGGLNAARERFLAGYARGIPPQRLLRAHLYEAVELINVAARWLPLSDPGWASRTERLVGQARAVIDGLQVRLGVRSARKPSSDFLDTAGTMEGPELSAGARGRHTQEEDSTNARRAN